MNYEFLVDILFVIDAYYLSDVSICIYCKSYRFSLAVLNVFDCELFVDSLKSPQRLRRAADERKFVELVMVADFNEVRSVTSFRIPVLLLCFNWRPITREEIELVLDA